MPALTQGPLPPRVYWVRRLMVLGTAVLLVIAIAHLLGNGSDASSTGGDDAARLSADSPSSSLPTDDPTPPTSTTTTKVKPGKSPTTSEAPVLAEPEGECVGSDIAVTPKVQNAIAGRDVMIVLQLRTMESPACTWRVAPETLTVSITSGKDAIWNSRTCHRAIARRDVVVRHDVTTEIGVVWKQAKRADAECSVRGDWAYPGFYHVTASALGGEPSDVQFELTTPVAATVTVTSTPKPSKTPSGKPGKKSSDEPTGEPTGSSD
ncbi:hypothetical protein [Nocardioides conyzicola]|uniref:DUF4232 domain-containing protein n=1 Tax=Nocardioides conyzicola TaxID=1651781 RepID=A0ABP8X7I3_9ACTN